MKGRSTLFATSVVALMVAGGAMAAVTAPVATLTFTFAGVGDVHAKFTISADEWYAALVRARVDSDDDGAVSAAEADYALTEFAAELAPRIPPIRFDGMEASYHVSNLKATGLEGPNGNTSSGPSLRIQGTAPVSAPVAPGERHAYSGSLPPPGERASGIPYELTLRVNAPAGYRIENAQNFKAATHCHLLADRASTGDWSFELAKLEEGMHCDDEAAPGSEEEGTGTGSTTETSPDGTTGPTLRLPDTRHRTHAVWSMFYTCEGVPLEGGIDCLWKKLPAVMKACERAYPNVNGPYYTTRYCVWVTTEFMGHVKELNA